MVMPGQPIRRWAAMFAVAWSLCSSATVRADGGDDPLEWRPAGSEGRIPQAALRRRLRASVLRSLRTDYLRRCRKRRPAFPIADSRSVV